MEDIYYPETPDLLGSWLAPLNGEILWDRNRDLYDVISQLDINSYENQGKIIELVLIPYFIRLNDISKRSFMRTLFAMDNFKDKDIRKVFNQADLPFEQEIEDPRGFFLRLRNTLMERFYPGGSAEMFKYKKKERST